MEKNPYGYASYLLGLDFYTQKPKEIVLVLPRDQQAENFYDTIFKRYLPNKIVITLADNAVDSIISASLLQGKKPVDGKVTAYVCQNYVCSQPVLTTGELEKLLR